MAGAVLFHDPAQGGAVLPLFTGEDTELKKLRMRVPVAWWLGFGVFIAVTEFSSGVGEWRFLQAV